MMRRTFVYIALVISMFATAVPSAGATEIQKPAPISVSFSGQGTRIALSATTADAGLSQTAATSCWSYTRTMRTGDGLWRANHDITWCASGGLVRSISRACSRYSATIPWVTDGCYRGDAVNLNRNPAYVRNASWAYCAITPVGCHFRGGFWDSLRVTATGGVSGSWGTW